jgi:hypothetical protein
MTKLTPNNIKRPTGTRLKLEKVADGLYMVKNAYDGHYEYFKGRPLRAPKGASTPVRTKT